MQRGLRPRPRETVRRNAAFHRAVLVAVWAFLAGCAGWGNDTRVQYDNYGALESTPRRPVQGSVEDRTYRNSGYRDREFSTVRVAEPEILAGSEGDADKEKFLRDLEEALAAGTAQVLRQTGRFGEVWSESGRGMAPTGTRTAELLCTVQALPHVSVPGQPVRRDPAFRDPRPKIIVVYTLRDESRGEVVLRFTDWRTSQWEYGPWAMEELLGLALEITRGFGEAVKE